jgi:hypothetical protein
MATSLSEIYDLFMQTVTDYRLIDLFNTSQADFENYLEAWLISAITDFNICDQDLTYDDSTKIFTLTLNVPNKVILARLMMKYWLLKAVNDVTQFNLHVTDRDYKVASEAQNLREKVAYLNIVKEDCSQLLIDYSYRRAEWTDWYSQNFAGV